MRPPVPAPSVLARPTLERTVNRETLFERAHLALLEALLAAGRHGEARRRYGVYVARMGEIGVEAASFPSADQRSVAA